MMRHGLKALCAFSLFSYCMGAPLDKTIPGLVSHGTLDAFVNQYVVRLTPNLDQATFDSVLALVASHLGPNDKIRYKYFFSDFRGFSVETTLTSAVNAITAIPHVTDFEPNWVVQHQQLITQTDSTYGLDRISHHNNAPAAGRSPLEFKYYLPDGKGSYVYVIDSGIYTEHRDFTGRATKGENYAPPNVFGNPDTFKDFTGHGTHVASIAAGHDYGVAKYANIIDVKVFNDNGTAGAESIVAGISYGTNDAQQNSRTALSVLQMSLGAPIHPRNNIIAYATQSAINAGIFCSVAAGNSKHNADLYTPAAVRDACTVGATDQVDVMAPFSNYGDVVDIWAPGVDIPAAGINGPNEVVNKSGTSMASPYVGGVAAYLKSFDIYQGYAPVPLCQLLVDKGNKGFISYQSYAQPPGPNVLLYDLGGQV